jgi:hypothetical protein
VQHDPVFDPLSGQEVTPALFAHPQTLAQHVGQAATRSAGQAFPDGT